MFLCLSFILLIYLFPLHLSLASLCYSFFIDFFQMTGHTGSNVCYEQVHPVTQPGLACALSFIYERHYQCNGELNNSDVIAFLSAC